MTKLISCCGLDCFTCEASIATNRDDDILRKVIAVKWKVMYNDPDLTYDMINCSGCREDGHKFGRCSNCEIRSCVRSKGFNTCADCDKLEQCAIVGAVHKHVPEALANLKSLS